MMVNDLKSGYYRHYKGGEYYVLGVARHSENEEYYVVYRCLYDNNSLWVRPLAMFEGMVEVEGKMVPRFLLIAAEQEEKLTDI